MKKTIVIGDVHGRDDWKHVLYHAKHYDKMIFIGDYFDSWDIPAMEQMRNFREIVEYKRKYPKKVVLLYGNHDLHYLLEREQYSGFQDKYQMMIKMLLEDAKDVMQWAYEEGEYLFTHAGVTISWCEANNVDQDNVVQSINELPLTAFKFKGVDLSGNNVTQGPCWVRPQSLYQDRIAGHTQVVGHTQGPHIDINTMADIPVVYRVDSPDSMEYLSIEDGEAAIKTYKKFEN